MILLLLRSKSDLYSPNRQGFSQTPSRDDPSYNLQEVLRAEEDRREEVSMGEETTIQEGRWRRRPSKKETTLTRLTKETKKAAAAAAAAADEKCLGSSTEGQVGKRGNENELGRLKASTSKKHVRLCCRYSSVGGPGMVLRDEGEQHPRGGGPRSLGGNYGKHYDELQQSQLRKTL
jgi:hypothetical protein